ncbi:hypothetical protein DFJ69_1472 [Thermomonospora umbrina]|uniref:Uncharacterized protein n=1 Tax=Thermomonospora umbrina TaxID=111806 RepID=A0A3D9SNN0_9ACTN|nr:hypothetical protein DFJ69_1472 [Thermomonospora umbrina]
MTSLPPLPRSHPHRLDTSPPNGIGTCPSLHAPWSWGCCDTRRGVVLDVLPPMRPVPFGSRRGATLSTAFRARPRTRASLPFCRGCGGELDAAFGIRFSMGRPWSRGDCSAVFGVRRRSGPPWLQPSWGSTVDSVRDARPSVRPPWFGSGCGATASAAAGARPSARAALRFSRGCGAAVSVLCNDGSSVSRPRFCGGCAARRGGVCSGRSSVDRQRSCGECGARRGDVLGVRSCGVSRFRGGVDALTGGVLGGRSSACGISGRVDAVAGFVVRLGSVGRRWGFPGGGGDAGVGLGDGWSGGGVVRVRSVGGGSVARGGGVGRGVRVVSARSRGEMLFALGQDSAVDAQKNVGAVRRRLRDVAFGRDCVRERAGEPVEGPHAWESSGRCGGERPGRRVVEEARRVGCGERVPVGGRSGARPAGRGARAERMR